MIVAFVGLFIWNRTENRADMRHMDAKLESNRNLALQVNKDCLNLIAAIQLEIKDFHGRLCAIEERRK